jgi:acetyl esterase/lipase
VSLFRKFAFLLGGALLLAGCSGADLLNLAIPNDGYQVFKDIAYGPVAKQKLDIYVPEHPAAGHPVIVFYYGGAWQMGSKDTYKFVGQAFASKGYITVIADYRVFPEVYFPVFMDDVASAFVWAHANIAHYGGNTANMFVAGHSAGAYNAVLLTLDKEYLKKAKGKASWIKAAVGIAGPYDFLPLTDPKLIELFSKRKAASTQPINFVQKGEPPMLLLHGDEDQDVWTRNTFNLAAKLRQFDDPVTVHIYPDVAHIGIVLALADGFRSKAPVLEDIATFLDGQTTR